MSETKNHARQRMRGSPTAQQGTAAVEMAIIAIVFFTFVFGIIELARAMYMYNTLAAVTQSAARGAANVDFRNTAGLDSVRQAAIFRTSAGGLPFGDPVTDSNVVIDYLSLTRQSDGTFALTPIPTGALPSCPSRNRQNCVANPYGASCIRFVRARICQSNSGECTPVAYQTLFSLVELPLDLPVSTTIVSAESLGYHSGDPVCP